MTLPVVAPLTLGQVLAELQLANPGRSTPLSMGDTDVKALAGAGGSYPMSQLLGKSSGTPFTITGFTPASPAYLSRMGSGVYGFSVTVEHSNGVGPITYVWSVVSLSGASVGSTFGGGSTSKTVNFNSTFQNAPNLGYVTLRVVVTDTGYSNRTQTADFDAEIEWVN